MSGHDSDVKCPAWFNSEELTVHDSHNGQPFLQSNCDHDDNCSLSRARNFGFPTMHVNTRRPLLGPSGKSPKDWICWKSVLPGIPLSLKVSSIRVEKP